MSPVSYKEKKFYYLRKKLSTCMKIGYFLKKEFQGNVLKKKMVVSGLSDVSTVRALWCRQRGMTDHVTIGLV